MTHYMQMLATGAILTLAGCATTVEIPTEQSLQEAFGEIRNSSLTIHLRGGAMLDADSAMAEVDSVTVWKAGDASTFPLWAVDMVSTRSTGTGILQGLGLGFLTGAAFGALAGFADGDDPPSTGWDFFRFTAGEKAAILGGGLGITIGVAGAIVGGIAGQHTYYELPRTLGLETDLSEPRVTGIVRGGESADDTTIVTITVPRLESQDRISIRFCWNGRLEWLPKSRIETREVPAGISISMPMALRRTLD